MLEKKKGTEMWLKKANTGIKFLVLSLVSGFILRVIFIEFFLPNTPFMLDGIGFLEMAQSLKEHGGLFNIGNEFNVLHRHPGFAYLIYIFSFFMDILKAGRYISIVASCLLIILTYMIAMRLYENQLLAGLAAIMTAWFPLIVRYSVLSYNNILDVFLLYLGVLIIFYSIKKPELILRTSLAAGVVGALAYLVSPIAVSLPIVAIGSWFFAFHIIDKKDIKKPLIAISMMMIMFLTITGAYFLYISYYLGGFHLTGKMIINLIWVLESGARISDLVGGDIYLKKVIDAGSTFTYIISHKTEFAGAIISNLQRILQDFVGHTLTIPIAVLAFYGLMNPPWNRERIKLEMVLIFAFLMTLLPLIVFGGLSEGTTQVGRYLLGIIPMCLIWSSRALLEIVERLDKSGLIKLKVVLFGLLIATYFVGSTIIIGWQFLKIDRDALTLSRQAGIWIQKNISPSAIVVSSSNDAILGFYSKRKYFDNPNGAPQLVENYFELRKVSYYVTDGTASDRTSPDENKIWLSKHELVKEFSGVSGKKSIYRLVFDQNLTTGK